MLQFNNLFSIYIHLRLAVASTRRWKQKRTHTHTHLQRGKWCHLKYVFKLVRYGSVRFRHEPQQKNAILPSSNSSFNYTHYGVFYTFSAIFFFFTMNFAKERFRYLLFLFFQTVFFLLLFFGNSVTDSLFILCSSNQNVATFMAPFTFKRTSNLNLRMKFTTNFFFDVQT